ncbi:hypothetical protein J3R30DRAFT_3458315 [Lentinula aciculospora]|uniref:F-box domain-containing protein n=1 Tax=Lentinula aciculospora TaxID=153920 RepID=A0A9W9DRH8_9AGAR|nr:hypothetical protein J3R30DRAFT_3458315 [Lentinula aciculospora]
MAWPSSRFDSFPSEVVAIIFELGTFSELGKLQHSPEETPFVFESCSKSNDYSYSPHFPVLVSHVSRKWRAIALNTPALWSTLFFDHASHLERGRAFLERCSPRGSGSPEFCSGYLLDIVIATVPFKRKTVQSDDSISKEELERIFDLLVPVTVRWRSLFLRVRDNTCKKVARDALGRNCGRAPNLEALQLYHFEDYNNVDELIEATIRDPVICFANDVPKLKYLSLIGVNLPWAQTPYLEGLNSLELALHPDKIRPPYEYWDSMLRRSPDLRKLILHYSGPKERWDEEGSPDLAFAWQGDDLWRFDLPSDKIILDKLELLSLTDMDAPYLTRILERVYLPSVQRLVLELTSEEEDSDYSEFLKKCCSASMSTIESSSVRLSHGSNLSISSISNIPTADNLKTPLLPFLPILTSLTLSALDCKLSVLRSLLDCLPELRELEIDFQRVCVGDTYPESLAWRIFAEEESITRLNDGDEEAITHSFTRPQSQQGPLLPKLQSFKILRLGGRQVESIIRNRECVVKDPCDMLSPVSSIRALTPDNIPARQRSMYIIKYTKEMEEHDPVLRKLIACGCCYFPTTYVEQRCGGWDTRTEPSDFLVEENPSAILRRLEPEFRDAYGRKVKAESCLTAPVSSNVEINGWTRVMVQSEMINADPAEEEEYSSTDDENESDFDEDSE